MPDWWAPGLVRFRRDSPKTSDCCVVTFRSAGEQGQKHAPSAVETLCAGLD
jgi:hypothetical protein